VPTRTNRCRQYDEDNIADFLAIIDDVSLKRITSGLDEALSVLSAAEAKKRSVRILPNEATYAFFEGLSCDALIRNEELLQKHFDQPFQLVQTKKRLRLPTILPAMARFLFSSNDARRDWAIDSWQYFKRNVLPSEFEWAVGDHLADAMARVQMVNLDLPFTAHFWFGVRLIISKVEKAIVTYSIRGLEGNFYKLVLDHLSVKTDGFLDLIGTVTLLLEKSPTDFWDAMDAITPSTATVVEQVLNGPMLKYILLSASEENPHDLENLDQAFLWIVPFLSSIKPANLTPACKAFSNFFFSHLQSESYTAASRARCIREGLRVLEHSFKKMNEGKSMSNFVGQPTVNGMLEILSTHIQLIVKSLKQFSDSGNQEDLSLALSMIQQAFTLESQSLAVERQLISAQKPSPTQTPPSRPIWEAVLAIIDPKRVDLATHLLIAGRNLIGLEPLSMKSSSEKIPPTVKHFNDRFKLLSQSITDVLDRLAEFDPSQLSALFEHPPSASALVSTLFSSTQETRNASVELLKVITAQDARRDAIQSILTKYYRNALQGISDSCRQVMRKKAFAPTPSLIKTCSDITDVMCNSQDGILRSRDLSAEEAGVTMVLWKNLWDTLTMIFRTTEDWSNLGHEKGVMQEFCRDTMQFADQLFDECSIFSNALKEAFLDRSNSSDRLKELLESPTRTMDGIAKWLRLRDEFLSTKSVTLTSKLLVRLQAVSIEVSADTLTYIERVLSGDVKAKLSMQQQAELLRALETHLGHSIVKEEPVKQKQGSISKWMAAGSAATRDDSTGGKGLDSKAQLMADATRTASAFQARREAIRARERQTEEAKNAAQNEFKNKRRAELEKAKQEREKAAALARAKKVKGLSEHTAEAGSGLEGLGVLGKEQAPKGEGLMHSSDESDDDEDDIDEELFGIRPNKTVKPGPKTNIINEVKVQMPVKKRRVQRSIKDMRARLAPDLSSLHRTILSWNYFHEGDYPPNSRTDIYTAVPNTFRTPNDYQSTFEPLLTLEAWQGFVKSREENTFKPYDIRIVSRASVDAFQEVSSTMTHQENKDISISEGDVVLLSQSKMPSPEDRHCLARVFRVQRKQAHLEVSYRVMPSNPLQSSLVPNGTVYGSKIQSITPLEREYGALTGLQYYDLCDEICQAKPSPLLTYKDTQLDPLISNYNVNRAQAKAIKSAIDNDAFTLIQGYVNINCTCIIMLTLSRPPGSGKTKTIVAIVGAILSDSLRNLSGPRPGVTTKKLLVCAPSNAAVDELVMRFKQGIKTTNGQDRKVNIVRIGRSDAINANVQDVTLEELVNKKLGVNASNGNEAAEKRKLFDEHKRISEQVRQIQDQLASGVVQGADKSKLADELIPLRRQKALLGTKIDNVKDDERVAGRTAELNRRKAQESILSEAHVICATLSGSGHEMFQGLSIEFETVIVDEAAQCVEMSALIPLKYGCAKCILVGDPKQLPPTVFSKQAARFQYEQSLFVRMQGNHPDDVHLLDTQYRMHPDISLFPSQTFYDGRLLDGDDMAGLRKRPWHASSLLAPYRFFDVQGQHQAAPKGHSLINIAEINVAMQLYRRLLSDYKDFDFKGKIGIITPYKSQLRELKNRFMQQYGPSIIEDVEFNTTDAFQGRESEVIIFSCVRASPAGGIGFLQDIRRMNVGLTRAKSSLWVLGNSQSLARGEYWNKLVEDAKRRGFHTTGDLQRMLNKHSSSYPAKGSAIPHRPQVNQEPQSRIGRLPSSGNSWMPTVKTEDIFKGELMDVDISKPDPILNANGKRKAEEDLDGMADFDTDMPDAKPESSGTDSGAATPTVRGSATPAPVVRKEEGKEEDVSREGSESAAAPPPKPGDIMGGMAKPRIRRRPRVEANPLMTRQPKKPKTG
jgi:senataxin